MNDKVIIRLRYGDEQSLRTRSEAVMRALVRPDESYELSLSLVNSATPLFQGQFPQDVAEMWRIAQPYVQSDLQVSVNTGLTYWRFLQSPDEVDVRSPSKEFPFPALYGSILHQCKPLEFGIWLDDPSYRQRIQNWQAPLPLMQTTPLIITLSYQSLSEMMIQLDSVSAYQAFLGDGHEQWWRSRNPEIQANLNTLWQCLQQLVSVTQPLSLHVFTSGTELQPLEAHVAYYATETELLAAIAQIKKLWHESDKSHSPLHIPPATPQERYYQQQKHHQSIIDISQPSPWRRESQAQDSHALHRAWLRWHKLHEALPLLDQLVWAERQQVLSQTRFEVQSDSQGGMWVRGSAYFMNGQLEDFYLELITGQVDFQPVGQAAEFQGPPQVWAEEGYRLFVVGVDAPQSPYGAYDQWMLWSQQTAVSWPLGYSSIITDAGWQVARDYQKIFKLWQELKGYEVIWDKQQIIDAGLEQAEFEILAIYQWLHPPQVDEAKQQVRFWVRERWSNHLLEIHLTQHGRLVEIEIWVRGVGLLIIPFGVLGAW